MSSSADGAAGAGAASASASAVGSAAAAAPAGAPSRLPLADDFIWPDRKCLLWSELWRVYVGTNEGCPQLPSRFNDSSPKTNWDAFWDYFIDDRTESERDRDRGRLKIWLIKKETEFKEAKSLKGLSRMYGCAGMRLAA
jgi:hypothetical protein